MKTANKIHLGITLAAVLAFSVLFAHGDTFGTGSNTFTIDFVDVGNPGNANDFGAGGGIYSSPFGGVPYAFRVGTFEVPQDAIDKATASGLANVTAGAWTGSQPATNLNWYEAAVFVNWLNTSTGHHAAYILNWNGTAWTMNLWTSAEAWQAGGENLYRHKDSYYFLPSENEWYKAAFHKNNGVTADYWDFATGSNSIPDGIEFSGDTAFDAVFNDGFDQGEPNVITNVGRASSYGTFGQNGNIFECVESASDGTNNSPSEYRSIRGGSWQYDELSLRSSIRGGGLVPSSRFAFVGFRVASVSTVIIPVRVLYTELDLGDGRWQYDYFVYNDLNPATYPGYSLQSVTFSYPGIQIGELVSLPANWSSISSAGVIETFAVAAGAPPEGLKLVSDRI